MRLSPLDIKKQEFTRTLRGYDQEEVQAFLDMLAGQWEESLAEQRRTEDRVRELKAKMEHYEKVEEALQEALQTARESSKQTLENARQEAVLLVKKAVGESEDLTRDALRQRDQLMQEVQGLIGRRDEIVARLRAFLMSEAELLTRFEERDIERLFERAPETAPAPEAAEEARPEAVEEEAPLDEAAPAAEVSLEKEERDDVLEEVAIAEPEPVEEAPEIEVEVINEPPSVEIEVEPIEELVQEPLAQDARAEEADGESLVETKEDDPPSFFREGVPEHFSEEEEPLPFKFFEPNEGESDVAKFLQEDEAPTHFAPDEETTRKREHPPSRSYDHSPSDGSRSVRLDISSSPSDPTAEDNGIASSDEIEKIRRILNDLD
ncbi:MAG: DivIVA domain-containing protein [Bacteroidetes bacterium]|nr:DivIVA domain-containing protein [Bacteroidota bacterium]